MKKPVFFSFLVLGVLVGSQLLVSEKVDSDGKGAKTPEAAQASDSVSDESLLLAGNVPCNPAKQVCED